MAHRAKRSLGQNFLVDANVCRKIVSVLELDESSSVLEIGPGQGALTRHILEASPAAYLALEKDTDLAAELNRRWPEAEIRAADALDFPWEELNDPQLRIAGNLPYNVGSRLIWDIVSRAEQYERAVFMVQLEVAQRLTATCGQSAYGALSIWVQNFARTKLVFKVPPTVFRPQPKVESAIVTFFPLHAALRPKSPSALASVLRLCFQKRRKQLSNILKLYWNNEIDYWLEHSGLSPSARPENVSPTQFAELSMLFSLADGPL